MVCVPFVVRQPPLCLKRSVPVHRALQDPPFTRALPVVCARLPSALPLHFAGHLFDLYPRFTPWFLASPGMATDTHCPPTAFSSPRSVPFPPVRPRFTSLSRLVAYRNFCVRCPTAAPSPAFPSPKDSPDTFNPSHFLPFALPSTPRDSPDSLVDSVPYVTSPLVFVPFCADLPEAGFRFSTYQFFSASQAFPGVPHLTFPYVRMFSLFLQIAQYEDSAKNIRSGYLIFRQSAKSFPPWELV